MANNLIQVKRTSVSGRAANTTTLTNAGELGLNMTDGIMYSTNGSVVFEIGANTTNSRVTNNLTVGGTVTATGIVSGSELTSTNASGDEGGQINLTKPPNATLGGGITIDAYQNRLRFFEQGGNARGAYIDLTACANGVGTNLLAGGGGSGTVTSVATGNGMTGGTITTSGTVSVLANTGIVANATGVFVNSSYIATISANNASFLDGTAAANFVQNTDSRTLSGNLNFTGANTNISGNLTIASTGELIIASGAGINANGSFGTANQVLSSNGTTVYWADVSGGGGFTNGQSISVNNFVLTGAFSANSSNGTSGQVLSTNGAGAYWSTVAVVDVYYANGTLAFQGSGTPPSISAVTANSQVFTGNGSNTVYTLSETVSDQDSLVITLDGLVQVPNTHYTISGNTLTFTSAPPAYTLIEARSFINNSGSVAMEEVFVSSFLLGGM